MATHNVFVNLPDAELHNSDAIFTIKQNGKNLAQLQYLRGLLNGTPKIRNGDIGLRGSNLIVP
jgi:hypothetical protein